MEELNIPQKTGKDFIIVNKLKRFHLITMSYTDIKSLNEYVVDKIKTFLTAEEEAMFLYIKQKNDYEYKDYDKYKKSFYKSHCCKCEKEIQNSCTWSNCVCGSVVCIDCHLKVRNTHCKICK